MFAERTPIFAYQTTLIVGPEYRKYTEKLKE